MISLMKKLLKKYNISLFRCTILSCFCMPLLIFSILYGVLLFLFAVTVLQEITIFLILIFSVILFFVFSLFYCLQCKSFRYFNKDIKKEAYFEVESYLTYSEQISSNKIFNIPNAILGYFHWKQRATFHRCHFTSKNEIVDNYFYYIQTKERLKMFQKLFRSSEDYNVVGLCPKQIIFNQKIPVKLIYGAKSHVVWEFLPIANYPYTKDQFLLFREINQQKYEKKYCNIFFSTVILFFRAFIDAVLILNVLCYVFCWLANGFDITSSLIYLVFLPVGVILIGALLSFVYLMMANPKEGIDILSSWRKKRNIHMDTVYLLSSDSFRSSNNYTLCMSFLFPQEKPIIQKLYFRETDLNKKSIVSSNQYVNWVCTVEKKFLLESLYNCREVKRYNPMPYEYSISTESMEHKNAFNLWTLHMEESVIRTGIHFEEGVPLQITYYEPSFELKSIVPVKNYPYTEEQLAAIEKFNTLYP